MRAAAFQTILCPVDLSDLSAHALRQAALLAKCGQAKIVAAYANWFETPPYFTESRLEELRNAFRDSLREAETSLRDFVNAALGDGAAAVETRVVDGAPADAIHRLAEETGADLVVMGTHGRTGYNRWMLGSVAERVLRESRIPVVTVRSAPERPVRHILCPVENTPISRQALSFAAGLGACFDATVTALHVPEKESGVALIANLCAWVPAEERARCNIRELVREGNAAEEIVRVASEGDYDLVVMGAPRRRFFEGMVLGATALRAVRHAPCPVLTVGEGQVGETA